MKQQLPTFRRQPKFWRSRKARGSSRIARNRVFAEAARSWHILLPIIPSGG